MALSCATAMAKKKPGKRERTERRFVPQATTNRYVVYVVGGVGASALGAGLFGQFGNYIRQTEIEPFQYAPWILAVGAVLLGVAIWIGTSTEAAIRVGPGGIAEERGQTRRMPWWRVEDVGGDADVIVVRGKDETGAEMTVRLSRRALPGALAWVVKEARDRARDKVELSDSAIAAIGKPSKDAGEVVPCPPLQVVGRRCAKSDKIIAYEPDARVCPKCERVYHKERVPKTCECGASLDALRDSVKSSRKPERSEGSVANDDESTGEDKEEKSEDESASEAS